VRQRARTALFLATLASLSVIALFGLGGHLDFHRGIYLVIFALVVGLGACWLAVTAMRRARRAASMRPRGAVPATVFGAISALLSAFLLIILAMFWGQLTTYSRCISAANTLTAQQACMDQLHHSLNSEISKLEAGR
jgi:predicted PurR-regulated permease PerM